MLNIGFCVFFQCSGNGQCFFCIGLFATILWMTRSWIGTRLRTELPITCVTFPPGKPLDLELPKIKVFVKDSLILVTWVWGYRSWSFGSCILWVNFVHAIGSILHCWSHEHHAWINPTSAESKRLEECMYKHCCNLSVPWFSVQQSNGK